MDLKAKLFFGDVWWQNKQYKPSSMEESKSFE